MATTVAPALEALLTGLIDYAGMYPPASLPRDISAVNYLKYRSSEYGWMLRWLVVGAAEVPHLPSDLDGALSVLADADEPRAACIEAKSVIKAARPVYCEVSVSDLDAVKRAGCFAKVRTG